MRMLRPEWDLPSKKITLTSLRHRSISYVTEYLCKLLDSKKSSSVMGWLLSHEEWAEAMRLRELAKTLRVSLPAVLVQEVLREGLKLTSEGKHRDLQPCFFELMMQGSGEKDDKRGSEVEAVTLPLSLRMDEVTRLFFLRTMVSMKMNNLKALDVRCYEGSGVFYMGEEEPPLLASILKRCNNLIFLGLRAGTSAIALQAIAEGCPHLKVLDLSDAKLDDDCMEVLMGKRRLVRKNSNLSVWLTQRKPNCAFRDSLTVLDLRRTKISSSALDKLRTYFHNLQQLHIGR